MPVLMLCMKCTAIFVAVLLFMQAYNFPADVSLSFGGPGSPRYFMNQLHYDNPNGVTGT